jgi:hypothetical protein
MYQCTSGLSPFTLLKAKSFKQAHLFFFLPILLSCANEHGKRMTDMRFQVFRVVIIQVVVFSELLCHAVMWWVTDAAKDEGKDRGSMVL